MLFNSYEYILAFLPVTVIVYLLLGKASRGLALVWVIVASVVFYAWWRPQNLAIIGPSIAVNYALALWLRALAGDAARLATKRAVLTLGLVFNLAMLGIVCTVDGALLRLFLARIARMEVTMETRRSDRPSVEPAPDPRQGLPSRPEQQQREQRA